MVALDELTQWARQHADLLERGTQWNAASHSAGDGWWVAASNVSELELAAQAVAGLEVLQRYAGPDSQWYSKAQELYANGGGRKSPVTGYRAIASLLRAWADQADSGVIEVPQAMAATEVQVVSTDIMSQVQALNADRRTHPAAAIVLAGAALETTLREVAAQRGLELAGEKPSLGAWARLLRRHEFLSVQEVKDIEGIGGIRNSAAHGEFDVLSRERAGLLEQQVNLLLAHVADRL